LIAQAELHGLARRYMAGEREFLSPSAFEEDARSMARDDAGHRSR
jgi:hypothetical protein